MILGREELWTTGAHLALAGIGMALVAAVPRMIDYLYTVPPNSSGKKRATKHAAVNLSAVALFALGWWIRGAADLPPASASSPWRRLGLGSSPRGAGWVGCW